MESGVAGGARSRRPGEGLAEIGGDPLDPALLPPGLDARQIHLGRDAHRPGDVGSLGLGPAHPAQARAQVEIAGQILILRDPQIQAPRVQKREVGAVHDPLRPDVHPAAGGHLPIVGHPELGGLVKIGGIVELAHHQGVGVDHPWRLAMAGKQTHGVTGRDHESLSLGHLLQILFDQPVLHPVLEHLPRLAVGDELVGIESNVKVQVVVDVELEGPGLQDAAILVDRPSFDVVIGSGGRCLDVASPVIRPRPWPVPVAVDAATLSQLRQELRRQRLVQRGGNVAEGILERQRHLPRRQRAAPVGRSADARGEAGRWGQLFGQPDGRHLSSRLSMIWSAEKSCSCR